MYNSYKLLALALSPLLILLVQPQSTLSNVTTPTLNLSAVAARDGASVFQCWSLPNFKVNEQAGTVGALNLILGPLANASYTVLPARFDGGLHNAPAAQLVVLLSGLLHITLPNVTAGPTTDAWIQGGKYGTLIAVDTPAVSRYGHRSTYPSDADTVALQIPFAPGEIPRHTVLYEGPCQWPELAGL